MRRPLSARTRMARSGRTFLAPATGVILITGAATGSWALADPPWLLPWTPLLQHAATPTDVRVSSPSLDEVRHTALFQGQMARNLRSSLFAIPSPRGGLIPPYAAGLGEREGGALLVPRIGGRSAGDDEHLADRAGL